ncbi:MAG: hypothetical protein HFF14_05720 [Angelakisella sp.]|jgi:hypothetical protein|nr:hypothetical protein [Angelakisella sp.]
MARKRPNIGAALTLDGEREFKAALAEINAGLKVNASQMQLVAATYEDGGKSAKDLAAAQEVLEAQIASQTEKVQLLEQALTSVASKNGESSKKTMEWQASLNRAKAELAKMETALKDNRTAMEKAGDATEDLSDELKDVEGAGNTAKKGTDIFNVSVGNLVADGIQKAISAIGDLLEKTAEYRADMSKLEQNTRDAGVSMDIVQDSMRRLNAITGETDSNIEVVSNLLAAGFKDNDLQTAIDTLSGAVIKFPDTIKIESLADSLQETLATREATGQFAETLERVGIDVDWYNKRIAKMSDTQARNFSISVLQKKGLAETTKEWRENNEQLIKAADAQYDLNDTMARFGEKIEPIVAKGIEELVKFLEENEEEIGDFIDAWSEIADVVLPIASAAFGVLADVLSIVFDTIGDVLGAVKDAIELIPKLAAKIKDAFGSGVDFLTGGTSRPMTTTASIPRYAKGTSYHPGGLATINDGGGYPGETVLLPRGSRVFPATQGGSGDTYNYYVTIDAKNIREFKDIVRIAENQRQSKRMGYVKQP